MKYMQDIISGIDIERDENFLDRFDDLFIKLSDYIFADTKILIAVSWGPDSMFLSLLIYKFFVDNKFSLDNLFFVHCNHKTRKETDDEQKFIEKFFGKFNLSVSVYDDKLDCFTGSQWQQNKTEKNLREWRYWEFQKSIDKNAIDYILTGHNLTDRIESSFMNMFRGSGLNGFKSMKFLDQNNLLKKNKWDNINILRPLLNYTKKEIEWFCSKLELEYKVDKTNLDEEISLRNKIRLSLFPKFTELSYKSNTETNSFFESMKTIYKEIDVLDQNAIWNFVKIEKSGYWNCDFAYYWDIPLAFVTQALLLKVLKKFNISTWISAESLKVYVDFFITAKQWYKYINGVYFFLSHGKIYIIKAKKIFWQKYIEKSTIIDNVWEVKIGKNIVNIEYDNLTWKELRFPKKWDKFWSKSWSKYCINQSIPVFWRNFIPVVVDWNNILKYFYECV